jgi:hypothetical protein
MIFQATVNVSHVNHLGSNDMFPPNLYMPILMKRKPNFQTIQNMILKVAKFMTVGTMIKIGVLFSELNYMLWLSNIIMNMNTQMLQKPFLNSLKNTYEQLCCSRIVSTKQLI